MGAEDQRDFTYYLEEARGRYQGRNSQTSSASLNATLT